MYDVTFFFFFTSKPLLRFLNEGLNICHHNIGKVWMLDHLKAEVNINLLLIQEVKKTKYESVFPLVNCS